MKVSAIPAQITTVEDRIAGNLNLTQVLLLATPLFLSALIFFLLPPVGRYSTYKLVAAVILTSICSSLAIRLGDNLVLYHIKLKASYELKPRIYVYKAQQLAETEDDSGLKRHQPVSVKPQAQKIVKLSLNDRANGHKLIKSRKYRVAFKQKTGGLIVKVSYLQ